MRTKREIFLFCLKKYRTVLLFPFVTLLTVYAVLKLYRQETESAVYAFLLEFFFALVILLAGFLREMRNTRRRETVLRDIENTWKSLKDGDSPAEQDAVQAIRKLGRKTEEVLARSALEKEEMLDFYTVWVHQVKTPLAVMKLKLDGEEKEQRELRTQLFRVERYAEMALEYIRLGSAVNDLVVTEQDMDEMIRETVRRLAPLFVEKKLYFHFSPDGRRVITDRKWFCCILDQLLTNAAKYTQAGGVTVCLNGNTLEIADTGCGIAPEDLPRIFERGFTGLNGRAGENSSGLGLYLAKRAADLVGVCLQVKSEPGKGSTFSIVFREEQLIK